MQLCGYTVMQLGYGARRAGKKEKVKSLPACLRHVNRQAGIKFKGLILI